MIFQHGDYDDNEWLVIGSANTTEATNIDNSTDCNGCWHFYYGVRIYGDYDANYTLELTSANCLTTST